jgi:hypothetical protein
MASVPLKEPMKVNVSISEVVFKWFRNEYACEQCGNEWTDEWSCMCNDRCPECRTENEPLESTVVTPDTPTKMNLAIQHAREQLVFHNDYES